MIFLLKFKEGRKRLLVFLFILVFVLFVIFAFIVAFISCFPGTGDRHGNCGVTLIAQVALVHFAIVIVFFLPKSLTTILTTLATIPVVWIFANVYLAAPLMWHLSRADLSKECYLQVNRGQLSDGLYLDRAVRIRSAKDFHPGWIVGEASPRVYHVSENGGLILRQWLYSKRTFGEPQNLPRMPRACTAPNP